MPTWVIILLTAAASYLASLIVRVLTSREKKITHEIETRYTAEDEQFVRSMGSLMEPNLLEANQITILHNGDEIFPAMLDAMTSARRTITFETFIYWSGTIGQRFADALCERAGAGVKVHVILDWLGTNRMEESTLRRMEDAGVEVERYHPLHWYNLRRLNNRTHRKLLVIDGTVGFTGGVGIADEWIGNARNPNEWRDNHFRVEGPVVAQLQRAFMDNWLKTHRRVLHGDDYFPRLEPRGEIPAQLFMSSPAEGSESARLMFLLSIASAGRSIRIASAYFVPDSLTVKSLIDARRRGVSVRVIVPGPHMDKQLVRRASRSRWGALLEAGVEIAEYQPTMYHCKLMIVDDLWVSVGSANFDTRSFRLNDEANLNTYHAPLAAQLAEIFERDWSDSRPFTHEQWKTRPLRQRLTEHAAGLLRTQL